MDPILARLFRTFERKRRVGMLPQGLPFKVSQIGTYIQFDVDMPEHLEAAIEAIE